MPKGSVAPFAFYHVGDLTADYRPGAGQHDQHQETFQKIYRPEITQRQSPATERANPA